MTGRLLTWRSVRIQLCIPQKIRTTDILEIDYADRVDLRGLSCNSCRTPVVFCSASVVPTRIDSTMLAELKIKSRRTITLRIQMNYILAVEKNSPSSVIIISGFGVTRTSLQSLVARLSCFSQYRWHFEIGFLSQTLVILRWGMLGLWDLSSWNTNRNDQLHCILNA